MRGSGYVDKKIMERKHSEDTGREGKVTAIYLSNRHVMKYGGPLK
jgi:hypothetical protein